jgi:heme O synthase-like polyprenyltransferase
MPRTATADRVDRETLLEFLRARSRAVLLTRRADRRSALKLYLFSLLYLALLFCAMVLDAKVM